MIKGTNVILRTVKGSDLKEMFNLSSRLSEKGAFYNLELPSEPLFRKEFKETGFWQKNKGKMIITTSKSKEVIGELAFFKSMNNVSGYDIGFQLYSREHWNKRYMTESVRLFSAYLFALKPIQRLQALVFTKDVASHKVLANCKFKKEGTLRKAILHYGNYTDVDVFSLLREDDPYLSEIL